MRNVLISLITTTDTAGVHHKRTETNRDTVKGFRVFRSGELLLSI